MADYQFDGNTVERDNTALEESGFDGSVLLKNAYWFIKIRWIVIAVLLSAGAAANVFPGEFVDIGLEPPRVWPLVIALTLIVVNPLYSILLKNSATALNRRALNMNLWLQIFVDLIALTALVHFIGSLETPIAITYLFHVALACIFFSRKESFWITISACTLFIGCVRLEASGIIEGGGIIAAESAFQNSSHTLMFTGSAATALSLIIVWYLVSTLSETVHIRDASLSETNRQLHDAMQAKNREMLRTVHDLKAPFASIETMIQTLQYQFKTEMPKNSFQLLERIESRAQALRGRIQELMTLGKLKSAELPSLSMDECDLMREISESVLELHELAERKNVRVQINGQPCTIYTNRQYLSVMLANLISNSIAYSHSGGTVSVTIKKTEKAISVTIADHGIGIREDALPRIFDEFYRTSEASEYNEQSTGLGLAIVKEVVTALRFKIKVASTEGNGTRFCIEMPLMNSLHER